jgi:hypothetical protein
MRVPFARSTAATPLNAPAPALAVNDFDEIVFAAVPLPIIPQCSEPGGQKITIVGDVGALAANAFDARSRPAANAATFNLFMMYSFVKVD